MLGTALAGLGAGPAFAQAIESVTVTAERRSENVQRVPLTINAFTGEDLNEAGVKNSLDLQNKTPGFVIKTNSAFGQPYVRGIGSDLVSVSSDSSVATFVDDVYQARPVGSIQNFYDIDRVEVVKGPQSTLFGRNVTGGAVRIFSKTPGDTFSVDGDALYGNYNQIRVRGAVNVPLSDTVAVRFAGMSTTRDGYSKNDYLGIDTDTQNVQAGRASLAWNPSDDLSVTLIADYSRQRDSNGLANWPDPTCCVNYGIVLGGTVPSDPRHVMHDDKDFAHATSYGISGKLVWDTGMGTFTSITGYRRVWLREGLDLDGTEVPFANDYPVLRSRTLTQDIQFASPTSDVFDWVIGANYLNESGYQELVIGIPFFGATSEPGADVTTNAYAAYAQGTYHFTDKLKFTVGLRYSYETRQQNYLEVDTDPLGALFPPGVTIIAAKQADNWNSLTPSFTLNYQATEDLMLYASASEGFKAGGFNSTAFQPAFSPEKLWAFEIGEKGMFLDGRLQLNTSAYWYNYKDIQVNTLAPGAPPGAFPIVINAASATIRGVDLSVIFAPIDGLKLEANGGYLDAAFEDFISIDPNNPLANPDHHGKQMPQAPKLSLNLAASYVFDLSGTGALTLRGEMHHQTKVYFNSFTDDITSQKPYTVFNARAQLDLEGSNWYVAVFGNNLTDELYAQTKIRQDPLVGLLNQWAPPRTYGVEVGAHFD